MSHLDSLELLAGKLIRSLVIVVTLLLGLNGRLWAQHWCDTTVSSLGDTSFQCYPPPDTDYLHNELIIKFYNGGLYRDSLCYQCDRGNDSCEQWILSQRLSPAIVVSSAFRDTLRMHGATYFNRMTDANCDDTLSVTRNGDTIPFDDYNWLIVHFDNDTGAMSIFYDFDYRHSHQGLDQALFNSIQLIGLNLLLQQDSGGQAMVTPKSELESGITLSIYPNPVTKDLQIMPGPSGTVRLFDLLGRERAEARDDGAGATLDISHLEAGAYFLRMGNQSAKVEITH